MKSLLKIICLLIVAVSCTEKVNPESKDSKAVDLGLSVKWASHNIGASSPGDYGCYYSWAETAEKTTYDWSHYKYGTAFYDITKYCTDKSWGTVDNRSKLETQDDAANAKWGDGWRLPTNAEVKELIEKCTWKKTQADGHNGYLVTGPNGNTIFIPFAGMKTDPEQMAQIGDGSGSYGFYWTSEIYEYCSGKAYHLYLSDDSKSISHEDRSAGLPIRAVK